MACYFEVETMIRGYLQYKEIWDAEVGEEYECQKELQSRSIVQTVLKDHEDHVSCLFFLKQQSKTILGTKAILAAASVRANELQPRTCISMRAAVHASITPRKENR